MLRSGPQVFRTHQCTRAGCRLRFPVPVDSGLGLTCPTCGAEVLVLADDYTTSAPARVAASPTLRDAAGDRGFETLELSLFLDNVRSLTNVGAVFRTADGVGVRHVYLGGVTPTPEHPKLAKTALGAERSVPWSHHKDGLALAQTLKARGVPLVAFEGGDRSTSIFDLEPESLPPALVVVVGHEVSGIDPRITELCDRVLRIPMAGLKDSLNVAVAVGIATYLLRYVARGRGKQA